MMTYTVDWVENKKDDWKVATIREIVDQGNTYEDVSINKVDKKGREFPNFDTITPGMKIHGNLWRSPAGKYTLFAPDPTPAAGTRPAAPAGGGARGVQAAQVRKAEGIATAQENKGKGVLVAAAFRDATLIMVNHMEYREMSFEEAKGFHKRIRDWYIAEYKATEKSLDVPF